MITSSLAIILGSNGVPEKIVLSVRSLCASSFADGNCEGKMLARGSGPTKKRGGLSAQQFRALFGFPSVDSDHRVRESRCFGSSTCLFGSCEVKVLRTLFVDLQICSLEISSEVMNLLLLINLQTLECS